MKESIGYTVSLNIMIIFITITIAFLCAALIYFKSNKASNIITSEIEKFSGYNSSSISSINIKLSSLGYNRKKINCATTVNDKTDSDNECSKVNDDEGQNGYCVYLCEETGGYYFYKVRTNMMLNIPIINDLLDIPIYSNTNRLYNFSE